MSDLTVSLELAKKMAVLGRSKRCEYNVIETKDGETVYHSSYSFDLTDHELVKLVGYAPTAQEILDELPYKVGKGFDYLFMRKNREIPKGEYSVGYQDLESKDFNICIASSDLAEALGQLRCWCKENGYLTEVN